LILDMGYKTDLCTTVDTDVPFVAAVEVGERFFEDHGLRVGDRVRLVGAETCTMSASSAAPSA
jgi:hypothetical protein